MRINIKHKLLYSTTGYTMFKSYDRDQEMLLPLNVRDFVSDDDLSVLIVLVVEQLDLASLIKHYNTLGQNAYHPRMLLSLLFYSYAKGVFSSRKIAEQVRFDTRFMYVAGMQRPDFRTISDFRKDHHLLLKDYFIQITRLCQAVGMAPLQSVSIDGSKVKASASRKQNVKHDELADHLADIEATINHLLKQAEKTDKAEDKKLLHQEIDNPDLLKKQINDLEQVRQDLKQALTKLDSSPNQSALNLTDPDCRSQKGTGPGYNVQISVDDDDQLIVGAKVTSEVNDMHQLVPMIKETEATTKSAGKPKQVNADSGYASADNYRYLNKNSHLDGYVPSREEIHRESNNVSPFNKHFFEMDIEKRTGICPQGKPLRLLRNAKNKQREPIIQFQGTACPDCPVKSECTKAKYRTVSIRLIEPLVQEMQQKLKTPKGRAAMKTRQKVVEPVFGQLKENMGFRSFRLRGMTKVMGEFALLCAAHNLKKLHKFSNQKYMSVAIAQILSKIANTRLFFTKIMQLFRFQRAIWGLN